jgi:hypothetical protein
VAGLYALVVPHLNEPVSDLLRVPIDGSGGPVGFGASALRESPGVRLASFERGECPVALLPQRDDLGDTSANRGGALQFALPVGLLAPRLAELVQHSVKWTGRGVAGSLPGGQLGGVRNPEVGPVAGEPGDPLFDLATYIGGVPRRAGRAQPGDDLSYGGVAVELAGH